MSIVKKAVDGADEGRRGGFCHDANDDDIAAAFALDRRRTECCTTRFITTPSAHDVGARGVAIDDNGSTPPVCDGAAPARRCRRRAPICRLDAAMNSRQPE